MWHSTEIRQNTAQENAATAQRFVQATEGKQQIQANTNEKEKQLKAARKEANGKAHQNPGAAGRTRQQSYARHPEPSSGTSYS